MHQQGEIMPYMQNISMINHSNFGFFSHFFAYDDRRFVRAGIKSTYEASRGRFAPRQVDRMKNFARFRSSTTKANPGNCSKIDYPRSVSGVDREAVTTKEHRFA